jgi:CBS domain-containing protein
LPVEEFIDDFVTQSHHGAYPLADEHGHIVGLLALRKLRATPRLQHGHYTLGEVGTPIERLVTTTPDASIVDVIVSMNESGDGRVLVFDGGQLVGIISPTDIARLMEAVALRRQAPPREHHFSRRS